MKKVKIIAYIVGVMWLVVAVQFAVNIGFRDEERMAEAFARTDASEVQSSVRVIGNYNDRFMTEQDRKDIISYILRNLGIDSEIEYTRKEGKQTISYCSKLSNQDVTIEAESIHLTDDENKTAGKEYVYVNFILKKNANQILDYKNELENIYKKMDYDSFTTSIQMQGEYEGKLTKSEKEKIVNDAIDYMQGSIVTEHISDDVSTVYAYTPCIADKVQIEKKDINMNLVFNYDEENKTTSFYMASPILNEDY